MKIDEEAEGPGVNQLFSQPIDIMRDTFKILRISNQTLLYYALSVYREAVSKQLQPNITIIEFLEKLRLKKYRLGIISDGSLDAQIYVLYKLHIITFFDSIIISESIGKTKPDPIIFSALIDDLDVPKNNIIVVGDNLEKDIKGGKNAGLKTIWVKNLENDYKHYNQYIDGITDYHQVHMIEPMIKDIFARM